MKIRNGFVSNSSSSSFVVVFPSKPKTLGEVVDMMGKCGTSGDYGTEGLSSGAVANRVLDDINEFEKKTKKEKNDMLLDLFSNRFRYYDGKWYGKDKYYGTNVKLLNVLAELEEEYRRVSNEYYKMRGEMIADSGIHYPESDYNTPEGKIEHKKHSEDISRLEKTEEFKEKQDKYFAFSYKIHKEMQAIREKIGKEDFQKFLGDNKSMYVFITEYSDNSGEAELEHGDIFRNLHHLRVSHH